MTTPSDVRTSHNPGESRYEAHLDGELAGFAEYVVKDDLVFLTHTEVDDRFEGRGVGSSIARAALEDVRSQGGRRVEPRCAFIRSWIDKHPEFGDLVA